MIGKRDEVGVQHLFSDVTVIKLDYTQSRVAIFAILTLLTERCGAHETRPLNLNDHYVAFYQAPPMDANHPSMGGVDPLRLLTPSLYPTDPHTAVDVVLREVLREKTDESVHIHLLVLPLQTLQQAVHLRGGTSRQNPW